MGFAQTVKSSVTTCTINQLYAAMDAAVTNDVCAEISDALERVKRGEMSREDFETYKRDENGVYHKTPTYLKRKKVA